MITKAIGIGLAAVIASGFAAHSAPQASKEIATIELAAAPQKSAKSAPKAAPKAAKSAPKAAPKTKSAAPKGGSGKSAKSSGGSKSGGGKNAKGGSGNKNVTVNKNVNINKTVNVNRTSYGHGHYRSWNRRAYYGSAFIGAVALGTIVAVSAPHVIPAVPGDNACWYWSDPSETSGYWDYCVVP